ncbi:MAG: acetyl-CoA carboxylase carboxyltransferase subunit beta [Clostridia bacterium]|nr:acetyl-CoA carboxylase carboxyltransferase subunit beta [Clostridia bacterium]
MGLFRSPQNELEKGGKQLKNPREELHEATQTCPKCGAQTPVSELWDTQNVCRCGHHFRMTARQRINFLADEDSFAELYEDMTSRDIMDFPNYESKLKSARLSTREKEAVICGTARIGGEPCALFVMDSHFMMGSMGTVVGEKITKLFEHAAENGLPVVGFTAAGGARMQEGILSLMQMAKTSGAVRLHSEKGLFYLVVLTDPTTGGVTASFAMDGDVIMAEPDALIGFAGARVIEQTVHKKLPEGFQRAEFLLEHGFVDLITPRSEQKQVIAKLLHMHSTGKERA